MKGSFIGMHLVLNIIHLKFIIGKWTVIIYIPRYFHHQGENQIDYFFIPRKHFIKKTEPSKIKEHREMAEPTPEQ
jgi:hypothetical protein